MRSVTLFHNPKAGDESHEGDELMGYLRAAGFDPTYQSTKEDCDSALRDPGDLVAVAGGDGTVREVATRLAGRGVPLALIPLGTANNIAKTLGVDGEQRQIIEGLPTAKRKRFDVWAVSGPWGEKRFVEGLGFGLFTEIMSALDAREEEHSASFGRGGDGLDVALRALGEALPRFAAVELSVTLDGEDLSGRYVLLEAMNIKHIGPNLLLAPDADPGDGYLDLVLVDEGRREELAGYLEYRIEGKQEAPRLPVRRGRHLRIVSKGAALHLDDEVLAGGRKGERRAPGDSPVSIEVRPGQMSLEFLVTA